MPRVRDNVLFVSTRDFAYIVALMRPWMKTNDSDAQAQGTRKLLVDKTLLTTGKGQKKQASCVIRIDRIGKTQLEKWK